MNWNICIQIKLFPNFHNKIVHLFFHHFSYTAVKSGSKLATATLASRNLPSYAYLTYPTYLTNTYLTTLPALPTFQICL